ncbi:MAG: hypothetical protein LUE99_01645 [Bacteroides sp.]|nr:hypothetical protein [Bacteroides sp.]
MAGTSGGERAEVPVYKVDNTASSGYQLVLTTFSGLGRLIHSAELLDNKTIRVTVNSGVNLRVDHRANGWPVYSESFTTRNGNTIEFKAQTESFVLGANYSSGSSSSTVQYETRYYDLVWSFD